MDDLHIFIPAGVLFSHRIWMMELPPGALDCLMRYVNDISIRIDVYFEEQDCKCSH